MTDFLRHLLLSAAVFFPVAAVVGYFCLRVSRAASAESARRLQRAVLLLATLVVAGTAAALVWVEDETASTVEQVLISFAVPLAIYLVVLLVVGRIDRHIEDNATRLKIRKALIYIGILVVFVTLLKVWVLRGEVNITTVAGIMGAGITLALQQQILCLAGWLVLMVHRYYDVGDRVQIGDVKGDVSDIGIFHTVLVEIGGWVSDEQSTGRLVTVPNSHIFSHAIYNYTRGFEYIWNELPVLVTYESDWHKAQQIILGFAREGVGEIQEKFRTQIKTMAQKSLIHFAHLDPIVYPKIADSGVLLTLRYLCAPKRRRSSAADLSAKILDAFAKEPDIDFAYPTTRYYDNAREGKAKLTPPAPEA